MLISSCWISLKLLAIAAGILATIPAKMISEIPLPTPRSVICSPSHIIKAVPAVRVMTVINRKSHPPSNTTGELAGERILSRPMAIKEALDNAQDNSAIAGVLGNFFPSLFTLFA